MNNEFRSKAAAECNRVLDTLAGLDPTAAEYPTVLRCLTDLFYLAGPHFEVRDDFARPAAPCEPSAHADDPAPVAEEPAVAEPEQPTEPESAEENTVPNKPEEPVLKKENVRAALAEAKANGISVAAIIQSFGVSKFSDIPAERYTEVMEKLAEAKQ